ncbi:DUF2914 domain-containing protein [Marinomonas sp. M1K-6]|uniref:DUF2914 domain-containing protein n=1 Tax=Marinomonas profundi TaxID=2726122 RepID=A0A847RD26_9GAMM|nr:DUF2914 domain-containing protein [Marinomonas profundi]NLQ18080.1 DUF2914 domain-containing protein [Marinomonas profundi]UDV04134.1 DUF2914 domain-containing protein [Marinomonas profundi]
MWQTLTKVVLAGILSFATILPAWAEGTVARAQFSTDVVDREPIDDIGAAVKVEYGEIQRVYFFTDLRDMQGSQVVHRWSLDGEEQAEVGFDIGGDRWRVWSSKRLMPGFDGKWRVDVVQDGMVIETRSFDYVDSE